MKIVIKEKLNNWNETINECRRNKYGANTTKKKEMNAVSKYLNNKEKITKYPVKIICKWHIKNMNCDLDNKSLKSILDELQNSGLLENDNCKHIREINYIAIKDSEDYVEIEILPL